MLDIDMLIKFAPASVATALASIVFPVPGGPKSSIPLQGCEALGKILHYYVILRKAYKSNNEQTIEHISTHHKKEISCKLRFNISSNISLNNANFTSLCHYRMCNYGKL